MPRSQGRYCAICAISTSATSGANSACARASKRGKVGCQALAATSGRRRHSHSVRAGPDGQARLRITLGVDHGEAEVNGLLAALAEALSARPDPISA